MDPSAVLALTIIAVLLVVVGVVIAELVTRRPCPRCGRRVKNRVLECRCGYDFETP